MSKNCNCLLAGQKEIRFEGNLNADIVFVFESPGRTELYEGRPVVGEAGKRWEKELNNISLKRDDVFIINAARCLIDKKKLSDKQIKEIVKSCRSALRISINHIKPKVIVACGGIASHSVMGVPITGITKRRGTWAYSTEFNCDVLYTYHPAATLHNESTLPLFQQDLRTLRAFIDNDFSPPIEETNYQEVDSIKFLLDKSNITIGIDTETQGLKWFKDDFVMISYSVSDKPKTGYNVVLWEEVLPEGDEIPEHDKYIVWNREKEDVPVFLKKANNYDLKVKELCGLLIREDIKKYTKNGVGYDCHVFESIGLPDIVNHVMDAQIASHALDSELYLNNTLDFLAQAFTTMPAWKAVFSSSYKKDDMLYSLGCNREAFNLYAIKDADSTLRVGLAIKEEMIKDPITANYYMKFVHPVSSTVLYGISKNGILIDRAGIKKSELDVLEELSVCESECIKRIPEKVLEKHKTYLNDKGVLNLNRNKLIIDVLFSKDGFGLAPISFTAKSTPDNKIPQVSKDILKQIKNNSRKEVMEFISWREDREELNNTYSDYLKPLQKYMTPKDRIHTSMSISGTVTGRVSCIRCGTKIEVARNIEQFPEGISIEDVEIGSWAYSYDDSGKPCMGKVVGKSQTGVRELLRVYWKNQPNSVVGYLDVTPEHEFRLSDGSYVQARFLKENMSICSLRRLLASTGGRPRLFLTNLGRKYAAEHRFIYEAIYKKSPEVVHHIDENILNNSPDNLQAMTVTEHSTYHNKHSNCRRSTLVDSMSALHALKLLAQAKGHPSWVPHDFTSYMKVLGFYGIDFREIRKRYNTRGEFLGKDKIKKSLSMVMKDAIQYLGIRFEKWQHLIEFYGFERPRKWGNQFGSFSVKNNHLIDRIEYLNIEDEVWDLEIEGTHNFIAGGLSVHNSRKPNTMVFPSRNKRQKKIVKSLFIAPKGYKLLNLDLSQAELRFIAHESQDERMIEVYFNNDDIHKLTAQDLVARSGKKWDDLTESERKVYRQKAKPVNFGLPYGMSPKGLREYALNDYGVKLTQKETLTMWNAWYALYPRVKEWQDKCLVEMYKTGKVRTIFGRNRYLRDLHSNNKGRVNAAEREGVNVKIQGPSSDYTLLGALQLYEKGIIDTEDIKLVNFVHDSLLFEVLDDRVDHYGKILKDKMEHVDTSDFGFTLSVPMKVDLQVGNNLANMKEMNF